MRWNPCGKVVDLGSRPFKCKYRPFRDSDVEVEIEWFPAAPGAEVLPWVSNISNPYWERDQYEFTDGDRPLESVVPTGKPRFKPGTGKGHVCGTEEDFTDGGVFDANPPFATYGALGLPSCCNPPVVGVGGVGDGGRAVLPVVPGASCETAPVVTYEATHFISAPGAGTWWVRLDGVVAFDTDYVSGQAVTGVPGYAFGGFQSGVDCASASPCGSAPFAPGVLSIFPASSGALFFFFFTTGALTFSFRVTADPP